MRYPPAPPIKVPDSVIGYFYWLTRGYKNDRLRGTVVFCGVFCSNFCFCSFFASVHFFCSEATPIIWRENANVNDFFQQFYVFFIAFFWTLYVAFAANAEHCRRSRTYASQYDIIGGRWSYLQKRELHIVVLMWDESQNYVYHGNDYQPPINAYRLITRTGHRRS